MNIYQLSVEQLSDRSSSFFVEFAYQNLIPNLLEKAEFDDGPKRLMNERAFEPLIEHFKKTNLSSGHFKNPELYQLAINSLLNFDNADYLERNRALFQMQMGLRPIEDIPFLPNGYYRFFHLHQQLFKCENGRFMECQESFYFRIPDCSTKFILPISGLYNDLVDQEIYPRVVGELDTTVLTDYMNRSISLLQNYSNELFKDFEAAIHYIVLTPNLGEGKRWSYNLRTRYQGGIFIDPFRIEVPGIVEALIHEYLHQRLWLWWAHEPLTGIKKEPQTIISPVTQLPKKVPVMLHAFLIYVNVYDFFLFAHTQETLLLESEKVFIEKRLDKLHRAIPQLFDRLKPAVLPGTKADKFLELVYSQFKAIPPIS